MTVSSSGAPRHDLGVEGNRPNVEPYYSDEHVRLFLGDCREVTEWLSADVLVTDPPYGLQELSGSYGRAGRTIVNDLDPGVRDEALRMWGEQPAAIFATPRLPEPPGNWSERLVWDKREPGMNGGPWRYTHELIFVKGCGWVRQSARSFSILSFPSGNGTWEKVQHPHAKPVALMASLIQSAPPGSIAEPFAGSGSTLVAAKICGRRAIGIEADERYCEIAARRLDQGVLDFGEAVS